MNILSEHYPMYRISSTGIRLYYRLYNLTDIKTNLKFAIQIYSPFGFAWEKKIDVSQGTPMFIMQKTVLREKI